MIDDRLLSTYLNDHLTGSAGGVELFARTAKSHQGTETGEELTRLSDEVSEDQRRLRRLMDQLGVEENRPMMLLAKVGERVGRLKPNAYVVRRSPLSDLVELETLRLAVSGKVSGWHALRAAADYDSRLPKAELDDLFDRGNDQLDRLRDLHLQEAQRLFS